MRSLGTADSIPYSAATSRESWITATKAQHKQTKEAVKRKSHINKLTEIHLIHF